MKKQASKEDLMFQAAVEAGKLPLSEFDHRAHLRLAYLYLLGTDTATALRKMRRTLLHYLNANNVASTKYHETITQAWIQAVRYFLQLTPGCDSADDFFDQQPALLDTDLMLSHYSAERLFSEQARTTFMAPDLQNIPEYDA